jgi:hypothetical protein
VLTHIGTTIIARLEFCAVVFLGLKRNALFAATSPGLFCLKENAMKTNETTFENAKVGDKVYSFTSGEGEICQVDFASSYSIMVKSPAGHESFTTKGAYRMNGEQTLFWSKPVFETPTRPKRVAKKDVVRWANVYPYNNNVGAHNYPTKEEADSKASNERIACVRLTGTYEVEEE